MKEAGRDSGPGQERAEGVPSGSGESIPLGWKEEARVRREPLLGRKGGTYR